MSGDLQEAMETDDIYTAPSAPPKTAKFQVRVDWKGPFTDRWGTSLQKALQSWCNSDLSRGNKKYDIHSVTIKDDQRSADVQIIPFEAIENLKNYTTVQLKFKDQNNTVQLVAATISFDEAEAMEDERTPSLKVNSTMTSAVETNGAEMTPDMNLATFPIPLHHYWYLHHVYKNELEQITKLHGVNISAEVLVSFKNTPSINPGSVSKASEEFQKLVQGCTANLSDVNISYAHKDSEIVKETMHNIQAEDTKVMMSLSASNIQVSGPKRIIDMISKKVNGIRPDSQLTDNVKERGAFKNVYPQTTFSLEMDMKDLQNQIEMDKVHWDLVNLSYKEELLNLQTKFGVSFHNEELKDNLTVKVRAQSKVGQHTDLENHATRALMQFYQKIALATVSCGLKDPKDTDIVVKIKEILGKQQYCVAAVDVYGPWRLVGLPEHLGPSMKDIEKEIGKSVFDEETKALIGYSESIPQGTGMTWEDTLTYGQGAAGGSIQDETAPGFSGESQEKGNRKDSEGAQGEEEQCVICMDIIKNKEKLKCGHEFCKDCITEAVKHSGCICPLCKKVFGKIEGYQPDGKMHFTKYRSDLPGYLGSGLIEIFYDIPGGSQTSKHPNPGQRYTGTQRTAYLPDNKEGNHVLKLLQRAFKQKLIFTIGTSTTSGATNSVTWNDIHHKTNIFGGPENYGYPDPGYLKRVKDELKAKGIE